MTQFWEAKVTNHIWVSDGDGQSFCQRCKAQHTLSEEIEMLCPSRAAYNWSSLDEKTRRTLMTEVAQFALVALRYMDDRKPESFILHNLNAANVALSELLRKDTGNVDG